MGYNIASSYMAPSNVNLDFNNQKVSVMARHVSDNNASGEVTVYVGILYIKTT